MPLGSTVSYVEATDLRAYAEARGYTVPVTDEDCEKLLVIAMDYLEGLKYIGSKTDDAQVLSWPRADAYVDNVLLDDTVVPDAIKKAQCSLANIAQTIPLFPNAAGDATGVKIQETVPGAVSVTYASPDRGKSRMPYLPQVLAILRPYLLSAYGGVGVIFARRA